MFLCFKKCRRQQYAAHHFSHFCDLQLWNFGLLTPKTDSTEFLQLEYIFCDYRTHQGGRDKILVHVEKI